MADPAMLSGALTVTVHRSGGVNEFGDRQPGTAHHLHGCIVAPGGSNESRQRGETVTSRAVVYAPCGADVRADDQLTIGGLRYEVIGTPSRWASPASGTAYGVEIQAERVTG